MNGNEAGLAVYLRRKDQMRMCKSERYICGMWRQSPVRYMGKVAAWWRRCGAGRDESRSLSSGKGITQDRQGKRRERIGRWSRGACQNALEQA